MSLDLEHGDEERADQADGGSSRRRRRRASGSSGESKSSGRDTVDLRGKLREAFDKLAEQLDIRGDDELASAIRDESEPMAAGFDSLTQTVRVLRTPLILLVSLLGTVLAFWRVGGILVRRFLARRERKLQEQAIDVPVEYAGEPMEPPPVIG